MPRRRGAGRALWPPPLAACRAALMHGEKIFTALNSAVATLRQGGGGGKRVASGAQRQLERVAVQADGRLETVIAAINRAAIEVGEALSILKQVAAAIALDPRHLEEVAERLFGWLACMMCCTLGWLSLRRVAVPLPVWHGRGTGRAGNLSP
ncbi:MAG: DNA repair protein RecN (Recombination protein N) [Rhodospirillaceae bacterium]|nr:MAG: DNA repair protein RecN (Recombination protein N) [Rhodospirillaceae bacterium]